MSSKILWCSQLPVSWWLRLLAGTVLALAFGWVICVCVRVCVACVGFWEAVLQTGCVHYAVRHHCCFEASPKTVGMYGAVRLLLCCAAPPLFVPLCTLSPCPFAVTPGHDFFDTASRVLDYAVRENDAGRTFPIMGICLGFETLMVAVAGECMIHCGVGAGCVHLCQFCWFVAAVVGIGTGSRESSRVQLALA